MEGVLMREAAAPAGQSVTQSAARDEGLAAGCPMSSLLAKLTRPWTLHILWLLSTRGPMRFGALRRSAEGISARVLTVRLRELEAEGFITRHAVGGKLPEVTYSPTPRMTDMNEFMSQLHRISEKWQREDASRLP